MFSVTLLGISAFFISLILTPVVRLLAQRLGLVDQPDHGRKLHKTPIPRVGGVSIFTAYLLSFAVLWAAHLQALSLIQGGIPMAAKIAPGVILIFALGIWDDIRNIRPWQKFALQIVAACLVYYTGHVRVHAFGGQELPDWLSLPATIFWLVLCTNAINLIDGVDGLATGVGVFATATTLLAGFLQNNVDLALAVAPLLGALLGFLRYNFNPATIFLGDSGSLTIGFILGCGSIIWSQKSATILGMTAPLLALAIPLMDTSLAIVRRFLRRQPLFTADRGHIHHRLLDRGLSPRKVSLLVYAICGLCAAMSLGLMNSQTQGIVIVMFCAVAWLGIQHLGYVEFGVAGRMFVEGAFRRHLNTNIALKTFQDRLKTAATPDECWTVIQDTAKEFGFHTVDMHLLGRTYHYNDGNATARSWQIRIPISPDDWLNLTREFGSAAEHSVVAPYADAIRTAIEPKLEIWPPQASTAATH